ncbi:biotin--[acetyl-CoA-carboxylase] ligase [Nocardioides marmorisolisilvae]|uniref:biotin--[acetyl-CoA-carboxylase] ligase n=1 Tax=Nocardioides marmorisolisilvae TaxID=1542737 RepID=UPI00161B7AE9|nr:biotin--[acetyl-CoA-carboxylase] ligase [Nocardioides marmorisolisilvae]
MRLLPTAESTNAVAAADPQPDTLVVADHQTAGRGRLDRTWDTPPGSALTFTAVVDPGLADADWPLLPLAVALAAADGVRSASGLPVAVKWPNDLLVPTPDGGQGKIAGILLERVSGPGGRALALIGIGINVALGPDELPVPTASSLSIAGSPVDRTAVFAEVVPALATILDALRAEPGAVLERYRSECDTVGRQVTVQLPDGETFSGTASGLDRGGRLVVDGPGGSRTIGAGDVVHVRPA